MLVHKGHSMMGLVRCGTWTGRKRDRQRIYLEFFLVVSSVKTVSTLDHWLRLTTSTCRYSFWVGTRWKNLLDSYISGWDKFHWPGSQCSFKITAGDKLLRFYLIVANEADKKMLAQDWTDWLLNSILFCSPCPLFKTDQLRFTHFYSTTCHSFHHYSHHKMSRVYRKWWCHPNIMCSGLDWSPSLSNEFWEKVTCFPPTQKTMAMTFIKEGERCIVEIT